MASRQTDLVPWLLGAAAGGVVGLTFLAKHFYFTKKPPMNNNNNNKRVTQSLTRMDRPVPKPRLFGSQYRRIRKTNNSPVSRPKKPVQTGPPEIDIVIEKPVSPPKKSDQGGIFSGLFQRKPGFTGATNPETLA